MKPHCHILRLKIAILTFVVISQVDCFAQQPLAIEIARYKDHKACAISYTFDDGLKQHATLVAPYFNKLGLKATFVVNGKLINDENHIVDTTRMTWTDLKRMAAAGHEISNHGWAHKNFAKFPVDEILDDILKNDSAIFANIGIWPRTFAYPNNTKPTARIELASKNRVGTRTFQRSLGGKSNGIELEKWVNKLIQDGEWGVTMTHGITYGYDKFSSASVLWDHLKSVKSLEPQVWVGTFKDVVSYITERDSTTLTVQQGEKGTYIVTPQCKLDSQLYAVSLTASVEHDWQRIRSIRQGNKKLRLIRSKDRLFFEFDPFGKPLIITAFI